MNLLNKNVFKLDKRIYFVFVLVVAIAIANALLSTIKIRNNKNTIFEITQYTNPTLESLEEFNLLVTRSRMFISNWVYLPNNNNDKSSLIQLNSIAYPKLNAKLTGLTKGWRSEANVAQINKLFLEYETIIREQEKIMKSLKDFEDYQDPMKKFLAEEQLESEIIPSTNKMMVKLRELITVKKNEAKEMQDRMLEDNVHLLMIVFILAIMVIFSVMAAGFYMMKKVILPIINVREIMLKMSQGELPEVDIEHGKSALIEMKSALLHLREGLQRTSSFAAEIGKSNFDAHFQPLSSKDVLGSTLLEMRDKLKYAYEQDAIRNWTSEGFAQISTVLHRSTEDIKQLSDEIICGLVMYIEAQQGVVYLVNDQFESDTFIEPVSFFAPDKKALSIKRIEMNEGLIGQVITSNRRIYLQNVNDTDSSVDTGISKISVCDLFIMPLFAGGRVVGALEIKSVFPISHQKKEFIERIAEPVASNILNLKANLLTRRLLEESQLKTRELAQQDEDLRQINNELVNQSERLKRSDSELRNQQETLQRVNAELENKALLLEDKNMAIEDAHKALAFKAEQLERSSKYKSDFLANMSHELRTPLNSVLILAKLLSENKTENMSPKQVEHANVIHKSGSDLLVIINDILDLSKIEAGKLELIKEPTAVNEICDNMDQLFKEVSREKLIAFSTCIDASVPDFIYTDRIRIEQVLKNLLSNAFKFTPPKGTVRLEVFTAPVGNDYQNEKLKNAKRIVCFSVVDTGIGIPVDKQKLVFEAFNQADSSTTRKYGGTGLGLTICRQLTSLLGGDIIVESAEGKGSEFKMFLPSGEIQHSATVTPSVFGNEVKPVSQSDFRNRAGHILVISSESESISNWTQLFEYENYEVSGNSDFSIANLSTRPEVIIIDATLSDKEYIERVFNFKQNPLTSSAYIICRSVSEYIPKEIGNMVCLHTTSAINSNIVSEILSKIHAPELFSSLKEKSLYQANATLQTPEKGITFIPSGSNRLAGKKVLVADDDIRNIYSMTTIFENEGAEVICAMDGIEAIERLKDTKGIDIILMDIMMPNMDGLQAIQEIRSFGLWQTVPIIAVTAKAMRGDREICLRAGASEYITKPVNVEMLLSQVFELLKVKG